VLPLTELLEEPVDQPPRRRDRRNDLVKITGGDAGQGAREGKREATSAARARARQDVARQRAQGPRMRPPLPANAINCSLEVKKVPRGMNDITHLNNHFSKFGKIANVAYKSTEAVLNNRFIKVFWHNPDQAGKPAERPNSQHPMSHNKVFINKDNIKATLDTKLMQNEKEQKELANGTTEAKKESTPNTIKPAPPLDKSKRVMEMYKRGQELLQTQLHQQRLLIQRLESGGHREAEERTGRLQRDNQTDA
ncbi:putative cutaneous T-cell lymphoma tumor antigen se70-2, partial [Operophtera brumata]